MNAHFCHPDYQPSDAKSHNDKGPFSFIGRRCLLGTEVHKIAIQGLKSFWEVYNESTKFSFNIFIEGHEPTASIVCCSCEAIEFNHQNTLQARVLDNDLAELLGGKIIDLSNTVVLLMSDHGQHSSLPFVFGADSSAVDNRTPLLLALFPREFLDKHPAARAHLKANEQALVTARDISTTLVNVFTGGGKAFDDKKNIHGVSLLAQDIGDRNCTSALIPSKVCICNRNDRRHAKLIEEAERNSMIEKVYFEGCA